MTKYDAEIDLANSNTSHAQMIDLIGSNKKVLDVGCSTGYVARVLTDRGCSVDGVESDPAAAEKARSTLGRVVIGDIERIDLVVELGEAIYDVVLFGDVLEHLRDPAGPLRQARHLLQPQGYVVVSVPNVAHGAVRLALLRGRFEYRDLGLLDNTHLRFFTRSSLEQLFKSAGLCAVEIRRTTAGLFETEQGVRREDYPPELIEEIEQDPDALTYQYVAKGLRDDDAAAVYELHDREERQREQLLRLEQENAELTARLDQVTGERDDLARRVPELERLVRELGESAALFKRELERLESTRPVGAANLLRRLYKSTRRR